jgi:hypothetical protein
MHHAQVTAVKACEEDEAVLRRARTIFLKRKWALYHWMNPSSWSRSLDRVLSAARDALSITEKRIYISEVTIHTPSHILSICFRYQAKNIVRLY